MCLSLVLLILQVIWFIERFRAGKVPLPRRGKALCSDPTILSNLASGGERPEIFTLSRNPHLMFPSNFHFRTSSRASAKTESLLRNVNRAVESSCHLEVPCASTSRTTSTLPQIINGVPVPVPARKQAFLQSISDPAQRMLGDSPTVISLGPLRLGFGGHVLPDPLPADRVRAPLAVQESTVLDSENDELREQHMLTRKLTLVPYLPPIHVDELKSKKEDEILMFENKFTKNYNEEHTDSRYVKGHSLKSKDNMEASMSLNNCYKDKTNSSFSIKREILKFLKSKPKRERKESSKKNVRTRLSLLMVCRLLFFVVHLLLAVVIITSDVGLYFLVDRIYTSNSYTINQSKCHTAASTTTNPLSISNPHASLITKYFSDRTTPSSVRIDSSTAAEDCSHNLAYDTRASPDALLAGTVEVIFRGRFVRVPYEVHARALRECLQAAVPPGTTPLIVALVITSYAIVFMGIVGN